MKLTEREKIVYNIGYFDGVNEKNNRTNIVVKCCFNTDIFKTIREYSEIENKNRNNNWIFSGYDKRLRKICQELNIETNEEFLNTEENRFLNACNCGNGTMQKIFLIKEYIRKNRKNAL